jgi:Phospholipase_D-nuclease N-terminal
MVRTLIFIFAVWLLFTVFVTVFAASAKKNEVRNLPKWAWIVICLFVPIIGGLLYLVLGRPAGGPKSRFGKTRIVAPDDDPTFLRDLSDKLEKEKPDAQAPENKTDPEEDSGDSASKDKS